eukprot:gene12525-16800_t
MFSLQRADIWSSNRRAAGKAPSRKPRLTINKLISSNGTILVAGRSPLILRFPPSSDFPRGDFGDPEEIEISSRADDSIEHIFLDPTGFHSFVCMRSGENYYLHSKSNRVKKISRLQGQVECVAFDRRNVSENQIKSFLLGTSLGLIYEIGIDSSGKEKIFQIVYQLDPGIPITSLYFETSSENNSADVGIFVMFATSSPTRLYHFHGNSSFLQMFQSHSNASSDSFVELPGDIRRSELHCYSRSPQSNAQTFAMMTEMGIYHGSLLFSNTAHDNMLLEAQLLPFISPHDSINDLNSRNPVSIAITKFHFLTLRPTCLQVLSRLNGSLEEEIALDPADGQVLGLVRDEARGVIWLYTSLRLFEVIITEEERNIWNIYLTKALSAGDVKMFTTALEYSKNQEQRNKVICAQADFHFNNGDHEEAALLFAQSNLSFDEVALRLINLGIAVKHSKSSSSTALTSSKSSTNTNYTSVDELRRLVVTNGHALNPLRIYLIEVLKSLPLSSKSQRTMLCMWLCEIFLHLISIHSLSHQTESELTSQFKEFLRTNKAYLDHATVLSLLVSHNHRQLLLFFSQIIGDYHRVVGIFMTDRKYIEAIKVLSQAPIEKVAQLIYKTSPILIENEPEALVEMLITKPQLSIDSLLPAIIRYSSALDKHLSNNNDNNNKSDRNPLLSHLNSDYQGNPVNFAIQFLEACLEKFGLILTPSKVDWTDSTYSSYQMPEPIIMHTLVWLLAKYETNDSKNDNTQKSDKLSLLLQACIDLKERRIDDARIGDGLYELVSKNMDYEYILRQCRIFNKPRSVVLCWILLDDYFQAVEEAMKIEQSLAMMIASDHADYQVKKKLWLVIAKNAIEEEGVDMSKPIQLIKESAGILTIDDLLPHLPDFTEIDLFKEEICQTLEQVGSKISNLKSQMDELAESANSTVTELENMKNKAYSVSSQYQKCEHCSEVLFGKQFYLFPCSHGFHSHCLLKKVSQHLDSGSLNTIYSIQDMLRGLSGRVKDSDNRARAQQEALQTELDGYIAADCPLCGYMMINSINIALIGDNEAVEAKSWEL